MAWIQTASGIVLPPPELGSSGITISTVVDGGRNASGDFIGSVIGEDKLKIEMNFEMLSSAEMQQLLAIFDRRQGGQFVNRFRVFDPRVNGFVWLDMYVGDRTGVPMVFEQGIPCRWGQVKANLIQI